MSIDADELKLYIDNEGSLHGQATSIFKNLATKKARSQYKHDLAVKAFGYLVEAGAKKYAKEFGSAAPALGSRRYSGQWHQMFPVSTRKEVAEDLTRAFEAEFELGNYDYLLPKKYQEGGTKLPRRGHAMKKMNFRAPEGLKISWSPMNQTYFALWPASAPTSKQQVLKSADADEMCSWLRETYGEPYGCSSRTHHSRKAKHTQMHDPGALRSATDRQLRGFYREEKRDVARARAEAARRGLPLHARKKTAAQLEREIAAHVPSWRGGR
jgi:hypothetical protein